MVAELAVGLHAVRQDVAACRLHAMIHLDEALVREEGERGGIDL
eukprot:CAMPEP_0177660886 /NCGR_PEP_ID=MMETSP0447-20121125/18323_1 /TAXON_ID=0 /ORGANISM="Stygamoeba regulata, Strain BSH-02190019" /LENGTH=43 /DNA_ID= /DNA_START= /DNA_END= /DNA_ORIENTATION=